MSCFIRFHSGIPNKSELDSNSEELPSSQSIHGVLYVKLSQLPSHRQGLNVLRAVAYQQEFFRLYPHDFFGYIVLLNFLLQVYLVLSNQSKEVLD